MSLRSKPALNSVLSLLLLGGFALLAFASLASRPTEPQIDLRLVGGSFSQSNSHDGSAIFSAANVRPGQVTQGVVTIANTGDLRGAFRLAKSNLTDEPGAGGSPLSSRLDLLVEDITTTPSTVYAGKVAAMGDRPLGEFAGGEARTYRFSVSLPDTASDNAFAGASMSVQYDWHSASLDDGTEGGGGGDGGGGGTSGGGGGTSGGGGGGGGTSGGGGGGGEPTPPPAAGDTAPPGITLGGRKTQKLTRRRDVAVTVHCDENCTFLAVATLAGVQKAARYRVPPRTAQASAGTPVLVKLKLPRKAVKPLRAALRHRRKRRKVAVYVTVSTADGAGNTATAARRVRLRM